MLYVEVCAYNTSISNTDPSSLPFSFISHLLLSLLLKTPTILSLSSIMTISAWLHFQHQVKCQKQLVPITLSHSKKLFHRLRADGGVGSASAWKTLSPYSPSALWLSQPALLCSALLRFTCYLSITVLCCTVLCPELSAQTPEY